LRDGADLAGRYLLLGRWQTAAQRHALNVGAKSRISTGLMDRPLSGCPGTHLGNASLSKRSEPSAPAGRTRQQYYLLSDIFPSRNE
jgi:hypothetical protein